MEKLCKCWNPEIGEDIAEDGSYVYYCENCDRDYHRDVKPRDEVMKTLQDIQSKLSDDALVEQLENCIVTIRSYNGW